MKRQDENPNDLSTAGLHFNRRRQSGGEAPGCQEETFSVGRLPKKEGLYPYKNLERETWSG